MELIVKLIFCDQIFGVIKTVKFEHHVGAPNISGAPIKMVLHGTFLTKSVKYLFGYNA